NAHGTDITSHPPKPASTTSGLCQRYTSTGTSPKNWSRQATTTSEPRAINPCRYETHQNKKANSASIRSQNGRLSQTKRGYSTKATITLLIAQENAVWHSGGASEHRVPPTYA